LERSVHLQGVWSTRNCARDSRWIASIQSRSSRSMV